MCFSPEASFAFGATLIPAGAYCLRIAWRVERRLLPLAAMPLLYGVQQVSEGFVWLGLAAGDPERLRVSTQVFLFFALAFWPFWNALTAAIGERFPVRRPWLWCFTLVGLAWFWVAYYPLLGSGASLLQVEIVHHSIRYQAPDLAIVRSLTAPGVYALYLLNGAVPLIWCSQRPSRVIGWMLVGSAVASIIVFEYAFISVWCFFSALLTGYLAVVFRRLNRVTAASAGLPKGGT